MPSVLSESDCDSPWSTSSSSAAGTLTVYSATAATGAWRCARYLRSSASSMTLRSYSLRPRIIARRPSPCGDGPASGPGRLRLAPLSSDRSVRRGSGIKRDFACTFTRHISPVLVVRRPQSRLRVEGRTRTPNGPSRIRARPGLLHLPSACRPPYFSSLRQPALSVWETSCMPKADKLSWPWCTVSVRVHI